jgi:cytochrome c556
MSRMRSDVCDHAGVPPDKFVPSVHFMGSNMPSRTRIHFISLGIATLGALAGASPAFSQGSAAEQKAVEQRQALLKEIDEAFKPVGEIVKRKAPYNATVVQESAAKLATLAPKIPDAFALDTHAATGIKTKARSNIWTSIPDFKAKSDALVKAIDGLAAAGKSGDEKALRPAFAAVGKACSACHDNYKDSD